MQGLEASQRVRRSVAKSIGTSAAIYGYPLVEMLRMCRTQTSGPAGFGSVGTVPIDTVHVSRQPPFDPGRVRNAGRVVYATAWMNLADGPRCLEVAEAVRPAGSRMLLSFHDASSHVIADFDQRALASLGGRLVLHGPRAERPADAGAPGVLRCATDLVWFVGRFVDGTVATDAGAIDAGIHLTHLASVDPGRRPAAVERWAGPSTDAMVDIVRRGLPASEVAPWFFGNLYSALAHLPPQRHDELLLARLHASGVVPGPSIDWSGLAPWVREGLTAGLQSAAELIARTAEERPAPEPGKGLTMRRADRPDYIARAALAFNGIGVRGIDGRATLPALSVPA